MAAGLGDEKLEYGWETQREVGPSLSSCKLGPQLGVSTLDAPMESPTMDRRGGELIHQIRDRATTSRKQLWKPKMDGFHMGKVVDTSGHEQA